VRRGRGEARRKGGEGRGERRERERRVWGAGLTLHFLLLLLLYSAIAAGESVPFATCLDCSSPHSHAAKASVDLTVSTAAEPCNLYLCD
jgi:hypothetical protein